MRIRSADAFIVGILGVDAFHYGDPHSKLTGLLCMMV